MVHCQFNFLKLKHQQSKMKNQICFSVVFVLLLFLLLVKKWSCVEAQTCNSGTLTGNDPPPGQCNNTENDSKCCKEGMSYDTYTCSPPVSSSTPAILTLNSFQEGGDGGNESKCDNQFHPNDTPVVALSTGWFNNKERCSNSITINGNGKSVQAMVVDECDSTMGCDAEHAYQPPCANNTVDASKAVWVALGVPEESDDWGKLEITCSDA